MADKIGLITSHYLYTPTREALERLGLLDTTSIAAYDDFAHIAQVYDAMVDEVGGFLVSGQSAMLSIRMSEHRILRPMICFQVDEPSLYKTILRLFLKEPTQKPERVVLDFLLPLGKGYTVKEYLEWPNSHDIEEEINAFVRKTGITGADGIEELTFRLLTELWEQGAFDLVICQYSSLIPRLEEWGIPYVYPFLSDRQIEKLIKNLQVRVELEKLRAGRPAYVLAGARLPSCMTEEGGEVLANALQSYFQSHMLECTPQSWDEGVAVPTTWQAVRYFTRRDAVGLERYLSETLGFETVVGYGTGSGYQEALNNARMALQEARLYGGSFLKDETDTIVGPLAAPQPIVVESSGEAVGQIAKACGLSPQTVQKLITGVRMSGVNKITCQELAQRLGSTLRNANRILNCLEQGGYARVVYTQTPNAKGRPGKVYELKLL